MNFIENETPTKLRGGYYTHPDIARFLTRWVMAIRPKRILEPCCGDGVFLAAIADLAKGRRPQVTAFEIEAVEAAKARTRVSGGPVNTSVEVQDFLAWTLAPSNANARFDAIVGNPPFIRYQYLDPAHQRASESVFARLGLHFTKHTNAWVPFVLSCLSRLRPGGRLAMVVPSELLHVLHSQSARQYLIQTCSRVVVIDPEEIWFDMTLQGVVLLLAETKTEDASDACRLAIRATKGPELLSSDPSVVFDSAEFVHTRDLKGKWTFALLNRKERDLLNEVSARAGVSRFAKLADVEVGIVTGANKFFLVSDEVVEEFGLQRWAQAAFGRSEHVRGVVYDETAHAENRRQCLPTNLLKFGSDRIDSYPAPVQRYIKTGEADGLAGRYKCRIRQPWYDVPSVWASPVAMLKRSHNFPRLVLNTAGAVTTDTAYRIRPRKLTATQLVSCFVNSLTALSAELEGRHYGGGVLELVPSEIERLLLPAPDDVPLNLAELDSGFRKGLPPWQVLRQQDRLLLAPLGVSDQDCRSLTEAWMKLRSRRQRTAVGDMPETDC